jgi:hypothetical protein
MRTSRRVTRRSFLSTVTAGITASGAMAFVAGSARAQGRTYTGVTDADTGANADSPGYGRGNRNVYTDQDTGPNADAQFHGRGPAGRNERGVSGQGEYGEGRPSGCTDRDSGSSADPVGRGTCGHPRNSTPTRTRVCSDSDSGQNYDAAGYGRHC